MFGLSRNNKSFKFSSAMLHRVFSLKCAFLGWARKCLLQGAHRFICRHPCIEIDRTRVLVTASAVSDVLLQALVVAPVQC
jgi:hypothetical protein